MNGSPRIVVLMPSYNTGPILKNVVEDALRHWPGLWLLVDGSTDGSEAPLRSLEGQHSGLKCLVNPRNQGKGATLLQGAKLAQEAGFTHFISMDADGQHPASHLQLLAETARQHPGHLIMGKPVFDKSAPMIRLAGRKLTLALTDFETGHFGLGDTLYGFRVYPIDAFLRAFAQTRFARGYDFDPEIAVRMVWEGCPPLQVPIPLRYLKREEGGISHFHYLRDNLKLTLLHFRLVPEYLIQRYPGIRRQLRKNHQNRVHTQPNPRQLP
jgi:glycosyltransferase involved in cell wall biosynthesis